MNALGHRGHLPSQRLQSVSSVHLPENTQENLESVFLPEGLDYRSLSGLSNAVVEKLTNIKPVSFGQASRISGVTPAAISVLQEDLRKP